MILMEVIPICIIVLIIERCIGKRDEEDLVYQIHVMRDRYAEERGIEISGNVGDAEDKLVDTLTKCEMKKLSLIIFSIMYIIMILTLVINAYDTDLKINQMQQSRQAIIVKSYNESDLLIEVPMRIEEFNMELEKNKIKCNNVFVGLFETKLYDVVEPITIDEIKNIKDEVK